MRRSMAVLSALAFAIALGLGAAQAQGPGQGMTEGGPPAAAPNAGVAPGAGSPGEIPGARGMVPGATAEEAMPEAQPGLGAEAEGNAGARAQGEAETEGQAGATAQGEVETEAQAGATAEGEAETEGQTGATAEGEAETEGQAGATAEGEAETEGQAGATAEGGTEARPGKSVRLESTQVSKVKTYFSQNEPNVKAIDKSRVNVSIGVALPQTVVLYDLPPDVIIVREECPIQYFVWGDDIVLVDSCTRQVVEIIVGIA